MSDQKLDNDGGTIERFVEVQTGQSRLNARMILVRINGHAFEFDFDDYMEFVWTLVRDTKIFVVGLGNESKVSRN